MSVSDTSPNADNYYKGTGIPYFKRTGETSYRDMGSVATVEYSPSVEKADHFIARGGKRVKDKTYVNQEEAKIALTVEEYTAKNLALSLGGDPAAAVNLVTTGDTHSSTVLDAIASLTGLVVGRRYFVAGTGIPANASFIFDGDNAQTLDRAATATATGVAITITCPVAMTVFAESQITGSFLFVSDNDVGPKLIIEALNCILTPSGSLQLLDSSKNDIGNIPMTLDIFQDSYGNFAQFYWNHTGWTPA
jgi:hypothetical protein